MNDDRLLILGLGNILMGDDGIGIHIINELKRQSLPACIDVIDGETPGIDLIDMLSTNKSVILVDAIKYSGETAAGIRVLSPYDILLREDDDYSAHDIELTSVLRLMKTLDMDMPEMKIIGIPAYNISPGIGVSDECKRFFPKAIELIMEISGSMVKNNYIRGEYPREVSHDSA